MKRALRDVTLATLAAGLVAVAMSPGVQAQVRLNINIGAAPVCPYGYYDTPPYACAPYGYYGPKWFVRGAFIGAGPWFHGPANFHGQVNNRLDSRHGYRGPMPKRGQKADPHRPAGKVRGFKGNETRDGHGHTAAGQQRRR